MSKREWTAERHEAARDRCNRATSGPWKWWTSNSHRRLTAEDRQDGGVAYGTKQRDGCGDIVISEADMAFIEEARLDLPDALAEIERLRSEVRFREDREQSIIEACERVADGGQYRADIVSAIQRIREQRDDARAENERLNQENIADRGMYQAQLANMSRERDAALAEVARLNVDLAKLGALKSAEVAPVIERFREAFGADVPQAPSGERQRATVANIERTVENMAKRTRMYGEPCCVEACVFQLRNVRRALLGLPADPHPGRTGSVYGTLLSERFGTSVTAAYCHLRDPNVDKAAEKIGAFVAEWWQREKEATK